MVTECIEFLHLKNGGIYVDATLGGGGHSKAMLEANPTISLFGLDQDIEAIEQATIVLEPWADQVCIIQNNFTALRTELAMRKIKGIDGILFDLGVSSHQIDQVSRGFSFEGDAELDMRMDQESELNAFKIVNEMEMYDLAKIIKDFGEELYAKRIAKAIVEARATAEIKSTKQLAAIVESCVKFGKESVKSKARVFQAIRIHVNSELDVLQSALADSINILNPGGRIVVMSYHSLEDRIVKQAFKTASTGCDCPPQAPMCFCNKVPILKSLTRRPILASDSEIENNSRSRSAKLRAAEKIPVEEK
jgi:16S rRNA (cytosine1402-N4)-methyltransferase